MLWLSVSAAVAATALTLAQENPAVGTRDEIKRLEELVAAGAVAPARLQEARLALADTEDAAILKTTLYGRLSLEDFTEKHAADMMEAARRRLERQQQRVDRSRRLIDAQVIARAELEPVLLELDARKAALEAARLRARLVEELVEMARAEQNAVTLTPSSVEGPAPMVEHFSGSGRFNDGDLKRITLEFEKEFAAPLPISAKGESAVHKALGFDHRGRVDVGVNPDSTQGKWIRKFLATNQIPYIAFRRSIAGQATAPHIHIGPPSPRLTSAD